MELDTRSININTIAIVVGFAITFGGLAGTWATVQYRQGEFDEWIARHESVHENLETRKARSSAVINEQIAAINSTLTRLDQMEYRMAQLEKADENADIRVSRISETYSNQFAEMRTQLSSILTQIALQSQTLQRMESARAEERP